MCFFFILHCVYCSPKLLDVHPPSYFGQLRLCQAITSLAALDAVLPSRNLACSLQDARVKKALVGITTLYAKNAFKPKALDFLENSRQYRRHSRTALWGTLDLVQL